MKLAESILGLFEGSAQRRNKFDQHKQNFSKLKKWMYSTTQETTPADSATREEIPHLDKAGKARLFNKLSKRCLTKQINGKRHFLLFRGDRHQIEKYIKGKKVSYPKRSSWTPDVFTALRFGGTGVDAINLIARGGYIEAKTMAAWISETDIVTSPIMFHKKGDFYGEWEIIVEPNTWDMPTDSEIQKVTGKHHNGFYTGEVEAGFHDKKSSERKRELDDTRRRSMGRSLLGRAQN